MSKSLWKVALLVGCLALVLLLDSNVAAFQLLGANWSYKVDPMGADFHVCTNGMPAGASERTKDGAFEWNYVRFKFTFGNDVCGLSDDFPNGVVIGGLPPEAPPEALAYTAAFAQDGKVTNCLIRFSDTVKWYTGTGTPPPDQFDWWSVAAHEMGHCLGLWHEDVVIPRPVMYSFLADGEVRRSLTADDIAGRNIIYGSEGKILVSNDEWPLSDEGFAQTPEDARRFALNLANYFSGASRGNFLVYSTPFGSTTGLAGTQLKNTMEAAGHTWNIISTTRAFTLNDLLPYDAIFLAGSTADDFSNPSPVMPPAPQVLIDYVKAGGNIYIASGTDPDLPPVEAQQWNQVLNACGLQFAPVLNNINQTVPINSLNPLFEGVHGLFQQNGTSILKLSPTDPRASILVSLQGQGLYAECSFNPQIVNDFVNFVPIKPFKTTSPSSLCPNFAGAFEFDAMLTGKVGIPAITGLKAQVTAISDGNIVQNADFAQASREGATITLPPTDDFADGVLTAGESVRLPFTICLQQIKPFLLTVDVLGRIPGTGIVHNVSNVEELINAINMANDEFAFKGQDTINMAPGTYTLSAPLPAIRSEIIINGKGSIIERSNAVGTPDIRIFLVESSGNLLLNDLTVRNGKSPSSGGGILNLGGTLTMRNTTVSDNTITTDLGNGGGICNTGTLTMINSTVSGNVNVNRVACTSFGCFGGGGIYNTGTLTMINSTVSGNTARMGAGIFNHRGTLKMGNSTVSGNNTYGEFNGGAILHQSVCRDNNDDEQHRCRSGVW